ncbi:MAG TPA: cellulase family glycosylhydrolase [Candidatus Dormibacteraeota bacterium]|nr:cellulase family glycosylhydrolase [Candidatus Dormibacteraeota bacterium]
MALAFAGCGSTTPSPSISASSAASAVVVPSDAGDSPSPPSSPSASPSPEPSPSPTPRPAPPGFVSVEGTSFILDGAPFRFSGFDIYQANSRVNCGATMGTGPALDRALAAVGPAHRVIRAWFFQYLATTNGRRDWSAFDHTLAVAAAHGVKVIVTLGNQWGSCEAKVSEYKWDGWYRSGYRTEILPGSLVPYRRWVAEVVTRYARNPTIAMWQLMNEAEVKIAPSTCGPAADLQAWAADVAGLVKSLDPDHLLNVGTGGDQCGARGSDYAALYALPTVDACEYHDYGHDAEALPGWIARDIAACGALGKPIFAGEVGIKSADAGGVAARASELAAKATAQTAAGSAGFLVWSWHSAPRAGSYEVGPGDPLLGTSW